MSKNSILSDSQPWQPPKPTEPAEKPEKSDWEKLGRSRKYKEVDQYLETRKEYWRHYLPDGRAFKELAIEHPAKAGRWGACASQMIDEIEAFQFIIQNQNKK